MGRRSFARAPSSSSLGWFCLLEAGCFFQNKGSDMPQQQRQRRLVPPLGRAPVCTSSMQKVSSKGRHGGIFRASLLLLAVTHVPAGRDCKAPSQGEAHMRTLTKQLLGLFRSFGLAICSRPPKLGQAQIHQRRGGLRRAVPNLIFKNQKTPLTRSTIAAKPRASRHQRARASICTHVS